MAIRVTCSGCLARFDVSEKFAGKEGPCPKCKKIIQIPALEEQVVVHAPEHSGPKDSKGRSILKPISRSETKLTGLHITLIIASIVLFLGMCFVLRNLYTDKELLPLWLLGIGAVLVAGPIAYVAYTFLRNQEAASLAGQDLWTRLGICSLVYGALWLLMPVMAYAFPGNQIGAIIALVGMIAAGGAIGMLMLEFDYLFGVLHYGMYLGVCLIGRLVAGLDVLPGFGEAPNTGPSTVISMLDAWSALL